MRIQDVIEAHYQDSIQISRGQAHVIGCAIASCGEGAGVLVFGCGNDSVMWAAMNPRGRTLFLENHPKWRAQIKERQPQLEIESIDYGARTVADSLPLEEAELTAFPPPPLLTERAWDVILVDSPMGSRDHMPGRSLSIYWASRVARPTTHVFIDDYRRAIERTYADHFFRSRRTWNVEVPRKLRHGLPNAGVMLWSLGV